MAIPVPQVQPAIPAQVPALNWYYFKPEFACKPDEDTEAHLFRTNDWMNTYAFPEDIKVQGFCLTLFVEARLWYESLRPIVMDCKHLQAQFTQQCSNTRGQLFHIMEIISFC